MNYMIIDEYSILVNSNINEDIHTWIAKEIENIKCNLTEDDYQIGMEVINKLSEYKPNQTEVKRDFQNILNIISKWEDIESAYGVELIM